MPQLHLATAPGSLGSSVGAFLEVMRKESTAQLPIRCRYSQHKQESYGWLTQV